jgi:hypothetical protein
MCRLVSVFLISFALTLFLRALLSVSAQDPRQQWVDQNGAPTSDPSQVHSTQYVFEYENNLLPPPSDEQTQACVRHHGDPVGCMLDPTGCLYGGGGGGVTFDGIGVGNTTTYDSCDPIGSCSDWSGNSVYCSQVSYNPIDDFFACSIVGVRTGSGEVGITDLHCMQRECHWSFYGNPWCDITTGLMMHAPFFPSTLYAAGCTKAYPWTTVPTGDSCPCYSLSYSYTGSGTIIVEPSNSPGCTANQYTHTDIVQVTAIPDDGWFFDQWFIGNRVNTSATMTFSMPAASTSFNTSFQPWSSCAVSSSGGGSHCSTYHACASTNGHCVAPDCYFDTWISISCDSSSGFIEEQAGVKQSCLAFYSWMSRISSSIACSGQTCYPVQLVISKSAGGTPMGTLIASQTNTVGCPYLTFNPATNLSVTALPNSGYRFDGWSGTFTSQRTPEWFVMPSAPVVLHVNFSKICYPLNLTVATSGISGSVSINTSPSLDCPTNWYGPGESILVSGSSSFGYMFTGWSGASASTELFLQFVMPAAASRLSASFQLICTDKDFTNWQTDSSCSAVGTDRVCYLYAHRSVNVSVSCNLNGQLLVLQNACPDAQSCPISCLQTPWSWWGTCSATCGGGLQHRYRITLSPPLNGGTCGPTSDAQACNTQACPIYGSDGGGGNNGNTQSSSSSSSTGVSSTGSNTPSAPSPCPPGQYVVTVSNTITCFDCPPGSYLPPNATACLACPPGMFNDLTAALVCKPCAPNTYSPSPGRSSCSACSTGTHTDDIGSSSCVPIQSQSTLSSSTGLDSKWSSTGLSPIHGAPDARSESNSSTGALAGMAPSSSSSSTGAGGSAGRVSPSSSSTGVAVGDLGEVLPSGSTSASSGLVKQTWFIVTVSVVGGCVLLGGIFLLVRAWVIHSSGHWHDRPRGVTWTQLHKMTGRE